MSTGSLGWQDENLLDHRRRTRNGCLVSLALHGLIFAFLVISPPRSVPPLPEVLSVELMASLPGASAQRARPAPPPPAKPPAPAPKPVPEAVAPPPPPPIPKAPVQVLPEDAPTRIVERKPEPKEVEKAVEKVVKQPEPKPSPPKPEPPPRRPREKELSYEDAMASLDEELGPEEDPDLLKPPPGPTAAVSESTGAPAPRKGSIASPEMIAWSEAATRRIQSQWVTPSSLRGRGLATSLELKLAASGEVLGEPRVVRSSGDPFFDDNAIRAVRMVNPLPPPPRAGVTVFVFRSEAN